MKHRPREDNNLQGQDFEVLTPAVPKPENQAGTRGACVPSHLYLIHLFHVALPETIALSSREEMGHTPVCQLVFAVILRCQMAQTGPTAARNRLDMRPRLGLGPDKHGATARTGP